MAEKDAKADPEDSRQVGASIAGRIKKIHVPAREQIDAVDLLFTIMPME